MRTLILVLAFTLLPCGANAASIKDFDGKWVVDLAATLEKTPELKSNKDLPELTFIINTKTGIMGMELPGWPASAKLFAVEREDPDGVVVKLENDRFIKLQPYGKGGLAMGLLKNQELSEVIYFLRQQGDSARPGASDKAAPTHSPPSF